MFRILLIEPLDPETDARLAAAADVVRPRSSDPAEWARLVRDCHAIIARTSNAITRDLMGAGTRLRAVGVAGVGVDRVDVAAAAELGIAVLNTPAASADAVAEFTLALILQLLRPTSRLAEAYQAGRFASARATPHGSELRERIVGILGMGRNGSRVARIAAAGFGAQVLYNDIAAVGPFDFPVASVDKPELWRRSEVLSLHVPLTPLTRGMVGGVVLSQLPRGALLINTARGEVVETDALVAALKSGHLAGAALDVTSPEPLPRDHPLFSMPNCILTPHVAARTVGGLRRMFGVVDAVLEFLNRVE